MDGKDWDGSKINQISKSRKKNEMEKNTSSLTALTYFSINEETVLHYFDWIKVWGWLYPLPTLLCILKLFTFMFFASFFASLFSTVFSLQTSVFGTEKWQCYYCSRKMTMSLLVFMFFYLALMELKKIKHIWKQFSKICSSSYLK